MEEDPSPGVGAGKLRSYSNNTSIVSAQSLALSDNLKERLSISSNLHNRQKRETVDNTISKSLM